MKQLFVLLGMLFVVMSMNACSTAKVAKESTSELLRTPAASGCYADCNDDSHVFAHCNNVCGKTDGCYEACRGESHVFAHCNNVCGSAEGCYDACKRESHTFDYCASVCKK